MPLRIVLMGTGEFAVPPFRALLGCEHSVVGVFTQPDKAGRGHHQHVNVVKELATAHNVPVFQPERINRPEVLDTLRSLKADAFIVAAYGQILKLELLGIPRLGAFNLHGSLLPRHRGAAPVQYSIWKGDTRTGVTVFKIEPALDSGPIVGRVETTIGPSETSGELMVRLAQLSVPLTLRIIEQLADGTEVYEEQDSTQVTLAPKIARDSGIIDWSQKSQQINCHVRAMQPWPKASTTLTRDNKTLVRCTIQQVGLAPQMPLPPCPALPGSLCESRGRLLASTGDGWIEILRIQPDGRKSIDGRSFVNGHSLTSTDRFV